MTLPHTELPITLHNRHGIYTAERLRIFFRTFVDPKAVKKEICLLCPLPSLCLLVPNMCYTKQIIEWNVDIVFSFIHIASELGLTSLGVYNYVRVLVERLQRKTKFCVGGEDELIEP